MSAVSAPFAHEGSHVNHIMLQVCAALIPCTAMGFYLFGWPAVNLWLVTCMAAVLTEALCLQLLNQSWMRLLDGSALLTGWLIALTLPPWAPWWIGAGGAAFSIGIGKQLYGGIGQNIFNPAMLARVALLIAFPVQMTTWVLPLHVTGQSGPGFMEALAITFGSHPIADAYTGATSLGGLKTDLTLHQHAQDVMARHYVWWRALLGLEGGSMGETSELLVLTGGLWLLTKRIISWEIPVAMLSMLAFLAGFSAIINPERFAGALYNLSSGGIMLGAFFIATDPVTSPISRTAKLIFGAGCATVMFVIRMWGSFPEGVGFAVLFMNALTPLLDRYFRPRIYGRTGTGKPLKNPSPTAVVKESQP